MAGKRRPPFNPKSFLAKVGEGRSIDRFGKNKIVFSQGDPANAIFYIQKGKVKVTVVSGQGKEAVVAILEANEFFGEGCLAGQAQRIATVTAMMEARMRGSILPPHRMSPTLRPAKRSGCARSAASPAAPAPSAIVFCKVRKAFTARSRCASSTSTTSETSARTIGSVSLPTFFTAMPSATVGPPIGRCSPFSALNIDG